MARNKGSHQNNKNMVIKKHTINFVSKPKRKPYVKNLGVLFVVLILLGVGGFFHLKWVGEIKDSEANLKEIKDFITLESTVSAYNGAVATENLEINLTDQYLQIGMIDEMYKNNFMISKVLLDTLNYNVPEGVFLTGSSFKEGTINITGYSKTYESVGQLAYNLRQSTYFDGIVIQSIEEVDENYGFVVNGLWIKEAVNASN